MNINELRLGSLNPPCASSTLVEGCDRIQEAFEQPHSIEEEIFTIYCS